MEPQRLNVQSWGGKSYDEVAGQVGDQVHHGLHQGSLGVGWSYPTMSGQTMPSHIPYFYMPAPYSVGHTYGLHPSVPGGGGGISGYGLHSNHQTKSWPWPYVHNNG